MDVKIHEGFLLMYGLMSDPRQMQPQQPQLGADIGVNVAPPHRPQMSDEQMLQMLLSQMPPEQQEVFKQQLLQYMMQKGLRGI